MKVDLTQLVNNPKTGNPFYLINEIRGQYVMVGNPPQPARNQYGQKLKETEEVDMTLRACLLEALDLAAKDRKIEDARRVHKWVDRIVEHDVCHFDDKEAAELIEAVHTRFGQLIFGAVDKIFKKASDDEEAAKRNVQ